MKTFYKIILLYIFPLSLLFPNNSFASHVSGGDITYVCTGPNTYLITMKLFRDCSGTSMSTSASVSFTNTCGLGNPTLTLYLQDPLTGTNCTGSAVNCATEISQLCAYQLPSSTCNGGSLPGMQLYTYTGTVTLPGVCNIWTVNYNLCCRNTTTNVSGQPNFHVQTTMNTASLPCNASPIFTSQPIPYVCVNQPVNYNYGVVETEGDSMAFALISALSSATVNVTYNGGYSAAVPIPGITINPNNGQISFTPTAIGKFVVAMRISEYRNGILIGTVTRDIQFVVQNCANNVPNATGGDINNLTGNAVQTGPFTLELCEGSSFSFDATYTDPDVNDSLSATTNITSVLTGGTFTSSGSNPLNSVISWTAPYGTSGNTYVFTVVIEDLACPVPGMQTFSYEVNVLTSTYATEDTVICNSQQIQLNASGGTVFTWYDISGNIIPAGPAFSCNPCSNPIATPASSSSYVVVSNQTGTCINSDTVNITVDIPPTNALAGPDDSICGLTINLAGNSPLVGTGTWSQNVGPPVIFNSPNSPSSSVTTTTPGTYQFLWTITNGLCSSIDSVLISFDASPTASYAGPDQTICAMTTGLAANTPLVGLGNWSQISGPSILTFGNPNASNSNITTTSAGIYELSWSITNGTCTSSDNVTVSFDLLPTQSAAGPDQVICGISTVLSGNTAVIGAGQWIQLTGPGILNYSAPGNPGSSVTINAMPWDFGPYTVMWQIVNGNCYSSDTVKITFDQPVNPADAGTDMIICNDSLPLLGAIHPAIGTGEWNQVFGLGTANFSDTLFHNSAINVSTYGEYIISWTVTNGSCSSADTISLIFKEPATTSTAGPDQQVCGLSATLDANEALVGQGLWTKVSGPGALSFVNVTGENSIVNASQYGTYILRWTISNFDCISEDSIRVTFYENPSNADAGNDTLICNQEELELNAVSPAVGTGHWSIINSPAILFDSTLNNTLAIELQTGANIFTWTNSNGVCPIKVDTMSIMVSEIKANFESSRYMFFVDDVIQLTDLSSTNPVEWSWTFDDGSASFKQHEKHAYQDTGTYLITLLVENELGCLDSIEKTVKVYKHLNIYVPNSFTPNGDGNNDEFKVYGEGLSEMELLIFNRWGELIYQTKDIDSGWNGRKNNSGGRVMPGVYVYKLSVVDYHGIEKKQEGTITIIK